MEYGKRIYKLSMSVEDVVAAIKMYTEALGSSLTGYVTIMPSFKTIEIPGIYPSDCDYKEIFNGLDITVESE